MSFEVHPDDFIIVVMGPTGMGKSNFINTIIKKTEMESASSLTSDTQSVIPHVVLSEGRRLVLVDTPGFDDTTRSDVETLKVIADWFTQKYPGSSETLKACGLIYFHSITCRRMTGSVLQNLELFGRLCGNLSLSHVRLVTTMWDLEEDTKAANDREKELKGFFWRNFLEHGAVLARFENTYTSAWNIVEGLLALGNRGESLLLQAELVEQHKRLNETEMAKYLCSRLCLMLEEQRKTLKELAVHANAHNDPALARIFQEQHEKLSAELNRTVKDVEEMKIAWYRKMALWMKRRPSQARPVTVD